MDKLLGKLMIFSWDNNDAWRQQLMYFKVCLLPYRTTQKQSFSDIPRLN